MKGVESLRANGVPFGVLAVVTREFLDDFNTALDFFESLGMDEIGFNPEVIEGVHEYSTMNPYRSGTLDLFRDFMRECYRRHTAGRLKIREIREYEQLSKNPETACISRTDLNTPLRIIVVGHDGAFSTFSPELHRAPLQSGEPFILGNVHDDHYLDMFTHPLFTSVMGEIVDGHVACSQRCGFFDICGGGSPSHKYFETGSMASTQTAYCLYRVKERATVLGEEMGRKFFKDALVSELDGRPSRTALP